MEFQYSAIHPEEVRSREEFYGPQMVWVVSGIRLKRDLETFAKALSKAEADYLADVRAWRISKYIMPPILQRWASSRRRVLLDFGPVDFSPFRVSSAELLWQVEFADLFAKVTPLTKDSVIKHYRDGTEMLGFVSHGKLLEMSMPRRSIPSYGRRHRRF